MVSAGGAQAPVLRVGPDHTLPTRPRLPRRTHLPRQSCGTAQRRRRTRGAPRTDHPMAATLPESIGGNSEEDKKRSWFERWEPNWPLLLPPVSSHARAGCPAAHRLN
eukprot:scaffold2580_cov388-Prasinococcus_capsulatus_cf.AAC.7